MPCFVCLNDRQALVHPYLCSVPGNDVPGFHLIGSGNRSFLEHFDKLWGPKWILFDLGNVLISFDHGNVPMNLMKYFPENYRSMAFRDELRQFFFVGSEGASRNTMLDHGDHDIKWLHDEFLHAYSEICTNKPTLDEFEQAWSDIFTDDGHNNASECIHFAKQMGFRVAIASTTNAAHWKLLTNRYPVLTEVADRLFLSFQLRYDKGQRGFFEKVLQATGSNGENHLLIDDKIDNINTAKADPFKMLTWHVTTPIRKDGLAKCLRDLSPSWIPSP
ncbi:MAG: HAD family hydrolase [Pirellulaceae bacterium]